MRLVPISLVLAALALTGCEAVQNLGYPKVCAQDGDCASGLRCHGGQCAGEPDASASPVPDASAPPVVDAGCQEVEGGGCPRCTAAVSGLYCGSAIDYGDPGTLYRCKATPGAPLLVIPCPNGCQVNAAGTNDACRGLVCQGFGYLCGNDRLENGADPYTLYHCAAKGLAPDSLSVCVKGCKINPDPVNDACNP